MGLHGCDPRNDFKFLQISGDQMFRDLWRDRWSYWQASQGCI